MYWKIKFASFYLFIIFTTDLSYFFPTSWTFFIPFFHGHFKFYMGPFASPNCGFSLQWTVKLAVLNFLHLFFFGACQFWCIRYQWRSTFHCDEKWLSQLFMFQVLYYFRTLLSPKGDLITMIHSRRYLFQSFGEIVDNKNDTEYL